MLSAAQELLEDLETNKIRILDASTRFSFLFYQSIKIVKFVPCIVIVLRFCTSTTYKTANNTIKAICLYKIAIINEPLSNVHNYKFVLKL